MRDSDQQTEDSNDTPRISRRSVYYLLIATSLGALLGRVCIVEARDQETPFLSANDRSRWCTVRALVDEGTFAIDNVIQNRGWNTIDKVRHTGPDGEEHFYSSKPTLYPVLLAGEYWLVQNITGGTFAQTPFYVGRMMIAITNVSILLAYFVVMAFAVERWGTSDWGRMFVMAVATWGTLLTAFGVTINNHLPGALGALVAVYAALRIMYDDCEHPIYFLVAGFAGAFAVANELPALSLWAAILVGLVWKSLPQGARKISRLLYYLAASAVIAAAFFGTNWIAHRSLKPAYAHREWYEYEGSAWLDGSRQGIDRGEPSRAVYALHCTIGHHGVLSLTPVWLLSILGVAMWAARRGRPALALLIASLTIVVLIFFLSRPLWQRNYGGVSCGLRWLLWLIPLWLIGMLPAADWCSRNRVLRGIAIALFFVGAASAAYGSMNPWVHPWLYAYLEAMQLL